MKTHIVMVRGEPVEMTYEEAQVYFKEHGYIEKQPNPFHLEDRIKALEKRLADLESEVQKLSK